MSAASPGDGSSGPVELAPTETAGQRVPLAGLPSGRRAVLTRLKAWGEATADQLASDLGITVGAVRQQLGPLSDDGLVAHRDERQGPGRPRRWYCVTPAAEVLFPKRYGQLTNQLLGYIEESDPALVNAAFEQRGRERQDRAASRLAGRAFDEQVRELARILDEDGYLADCDRTGEDTWLITERNCAILDVARHHREACRTELAFLEGVLPGARVQRVAHVLAGAHHCAYEVRLSGSGPQEATTPTE